MRRTEMTRIGTRLCNNLRLIGREIRRKDESAQSEKKLRWR